MNATEHLPNLSALSQVRNLSLRNQYTANELAVLLGLSKCQARRIFLQLGPVILSPHRRFVKAESIEDHLARQEVVAQGPPSVAMQLGHVCGVLQRIDERLARLESA